MHKAALCPVVPMMLVATFAFSQTSSIQLSISQPENGDVVPRRLNVSGTSAGLGTNKIVLFVYSPPAKRWFFQGPPRISRKLSGMLAIYFIQVTPTCCGRQITAFWRI